MAKLISQTALRKQIGIALADMRAAVYLDQAFKPVEFMGYRFTACRLYKTPGQTGYVWKTNYSGEPCAHETQLRWPTSAYGQISGTLDECAAQLHSRLRTETKDECVPA